MYRISYVGPQSERYIPHGWDILQTATPRAGPAANNTPRSVFTGGGYTLGSDDMESTYIPDPDAQGLSSKGIPPPVHLSIDPPATRQTLPLRFDI